MSRATAILLLGMAFFFPLAGRAGSFPDFGYEPPAGWTGPRFELSQDYPALPPPPEAVPWKAIDFTTDPEGYLNAVRAYCLEGNLAVDFVVQNNAIRKWYHAPWLHWGNNGREFVHGLTRERTSRRFELAATQDRTFRNYAIGFYNARGAFTIGQVWADPAMPKTDEVAFLEDTVSFKLLFTTATAAKVPYLEGAPEWAADLNRSPDPDAIAQTKVRLLQVDIAVRDERSTEAGWVFGTFQYDAAQPGATPWERLRPVALMWGNDPALKESDFLAGARPAQSWINPAAPIVMYRSNPPMGLDPPRVLGWAGRANGPVDNPVSSCLSCHSTAQLPASSPMVPNAALTEPQKLRWFRNLAVGEAFDAGAKTLDFSLQLGVGIQNHQEFLEFVRNQGGVMASRSRLPGRYAAPSKAPPAPAPDAPARAEYRFTRDPE